MYNLVDCGEAKMPNRKLNYINGFLTILFGLTNGKSTAAVDSIDRFFSEKDTMFVLTFHRIINSFCNNEI